jgi:hypothetical protein
LTSLALAHWARSANRTQADEISTLANRAGVGEVQAWSAASAMDLTPNGLMRMLLTVAAIQELNATGRAMPTGALQQRLALLRSLAAEQPAPPKRTGSVEAARGTALFPAALYQNTRPLNITGARALEIIQNIDGQPTRTDPEQWFKFWSDQCALLGKMPTLGDLQGVLRAKLSSFANKILAPEAVPQPILTRAEAPESVHEFHVPFFGTRTDSWRGEEGFIVGSSGYSGEGSLWARTMTNTDIYASKKSLITIFKETALEDFIDLQVDEARKDRVWEKIDRPRFETGSRIQVVQDLRFMFHLGQFTDPRVIAQAKPAIDTLLSSEPGSARRVAATKELRAVLKNGPGRGGPDAGTLRAVRTEMVLVQVLSAYFEESGLAKQYKTGKVDANMVFDMGRVHQIYLETQQRNELISLEEVRAMLSRIGVSAK